MLTKPNAKILAAIVGPLALIAATPSAQAAPPQSTATTTATANAELRLPHISITTTGKGTPVVLIPGLSSPRAVWDGVVPTLAKTHEVILVQVNGFGGDAPGDNLKAGLLDGAVADLHGYLAKRKLSKVAVAGHSMGGLLTMMLAKAHPGDVGKAMIVDTLPYVGEIFVPGATVAMLEPQAKAMQAQMAASYGKPGDTAMTQAGAARLALKPESIARVTAWTLAADPRVTGQALYEAMTTDLRPEMGAIATPLTVIVPFSTLLPEERAKAMYGAAYAKAPNAKIVTVGDSAHFVMLDQPAAFQTALDAFLSR